MNIELLKMTLNLLAASAMYILVQKEDHLIDKPILHQSTKRSDRKKKRRKI